MTAPEEKDQPSWLAVAKLLRPQGRKGELLADPLTDLPEVFVADRQFRLVSEGKSPDTAPSALLEASWRPQGRNAGRIVLKLAGVDSISAAEALEGQELFLEEAGLPALDADTFFVRDLIGCTLFDGEQALGTVLGLEFPVAADGHTRLADAVDILVVQSLAADEAGEPAMVPFVKAWLRSVDLTARRITMELPPGLFDPNA